MRYEDGSEAKEIVDSLYCDFDWYYLEKWTKKDINQFKNLVRELNDLSRKIK
jgi:hypothetical protein